MYTANKIKTFRPARRCRHGPSRVLFILCLLYAINVALPSVGLAANSLSQFGITWTFDKDYSVGQFANGDYWVVGPVNITDITRPAGSVERDGSMVNPIPSQQHAYDSRVATYTSNLNVANSLPLTVNPNESLVSAISGPLSRPVLKTAAVLTVLGDIPPGGSFRPPYAGNEKPIYSSINLRRDLLLSLEPVGSSPTLTSVESMFERPWIDHRLGWLGDYLHPYENMQNYGAGIALESGAGALRLLLNDPIDDKELLLIRYVQLGIDNFGLVKSGAYWGDVGGTIGVGRKIPILFAGLMLDNSEIKSVASNHDTRWVFQEDGQTFYLTQAERDGTYDPINCAGDPEYCYPGYYDSIPLGTPAWGERHYRWLTTSYAWLPGKIAYLGSTYKSTIGTALTVHLLGIEGLWNYDPFLDWMDRSWSEGVTGPWGSVFADDMWDTYRADYGPVWPETDSIPPLAPTNLDSANQTESAISLSWTAPGPASDGDLASMYRILRNGILKGLAAGTSFEDTGLNANTDYSYQIYSIDDAGNQSASAAIGTFSTLADTTPPSVVSVSASETSVEITFSESLDTISAEQTNNYSINNGISVTAASLNTDTVILTTSAHTEGLTYTLTVVDIQDLAGNPMGQTEIDYQYNQGLVGYWKFDDGSGNSAVDSSGNGNTGTLINGPVWTVQGELSFDGIDDAVEIGTAGLSSGSGTIALWSYAVSFATTGQYLFGHATQPWANRIQFYTDDIEGYLDLGLGDTHTRHTNIENLATQRWYHIALTWDGSNYTVYVDGTARATGAYSGLSTLETYADIGNNGDRADRTEAFNGTIDEVRVYNRALTAGEILDLYNEGTTPDTTPPVISNVQSSNVTTSQATITWNTDENSTSQVEYGLDTSYGSATDLDTSLVTSHSVLLTGLASETLYHYHVMSKDASGNESISQDNTFPTSGVSTYSITASANGGGTIGPSGTTQVVPGGSQAYSITVNSGYHISDVLVDGSSVGAVTSYSFTNVTADHTIAATFAINTYTITASAGSGGTISPSGTTQVNWSGTQSYTITLNAGYHISDVLVDGSSVGVVTSYSFTNVTANHTIAATFAEQDVTKPIVTNLSPQTDSIQAPLNTLVILDITDSGDGVDANSVTVKVNNNIVYTGNTNHYPSADGDCRRLGTKADYKFIYHRWKQNFDFDQPINITVNATDLAGNIMDEYSYSFKSEMRSFGENKILSSGSSNDNWGPLTTVSDSSGNIWVAWPQGVVGSRDIYIGKLTVGTDSFVSSGVVQVTNDSNDQGNPVLAVDGVDKLYLAWQDNRQGEWDIYISTSDDWSTQTKITDPNSNQINPAIAVDSTDKVYVVWEDDQNSDKDIYIASSTNSFSTQVTTRITSAIYDQITPDIAVGYGDIADLFDDTVYVVWADARSWDGNGNPKYDLYGAASDNSWTNILIVTENDQQSSPKIATEAVGSVLHLVWLDDTNGDDDIYYATSDGLPASPLTGSSIIDPCEPGADQISPVIITTGTGNNLKVFACWRDERNADADLYAVEIGAGAGTNVFVGDDDTSTDQSEPAIGIDEYGHPYLVWINERTDICYAGSTFIEPVVLASSTASVSSKTTVGTVPGSITNIDDVSAELPQGAYLCDVKVTISRIRNPHKPPSNNRTFLYEFGPSGTTFSEPVTITIPYNATTLVSSPSAYWYNPLTGLYSQEGITDVEVIQISSGLYALRFKTTHFSIFGGGGLFGGGGGGGGCSMSPNSQGSIVEFLLPYIGLAVAMVVLKLRDRRKRKAHNITKSEC